MHVYCLADACVPHRNGLTVEIDQQPYKVIEFLHVKPGKGAAFVRTKLKNFLTGG